MFQEKNEEKEEHQAKGLIFWIVSGTLSLLLLMAVKGCFPDATPYDTFRFWHDNQIMAGIVAGWPIYLWGALITGIVAIFTLNKREVNENAEKVFGLGILASAIAGIFEEMLFRWIVFLWGIVTVKVVNFLFFGFLGFGLPEFLHSWFFGPIVNFLTFGKMEWLIFGQGWAVGAAALAANAKFRTEHSYLGFAGWINSWIIGFFLFWIMFEYGLMAAIMVHFIYDLIIFTIISLDAFQERARGVYKI